ncbi:MAG TPA: translation initiation factor IF-2 subunit alpha [Thermoplasmata archaeon]|nr:translation initiation factor IF-2 subunit alpha [Thermoplasmata archaeon]HEV2429210.1 translation initiation factor IF-2 subunit alpha [Thermoplasmata archaeon]
MPLRAEFPEEGELVVGTVTSIRNFGAFVKLDEFENREAFIHLSEVATGWVKYIRDHIREGQKIVARVLRIDSSKGQIDLSLKRINDHQRREKVQSWKNEQRAIRLLAVVAAQLKIDVEATYALFTDSLIERYGSLFAAFEAASSDPKRFQKDAGKGAWVTAFLHVAEENLVPPHIAVRGTLELSDPAPDGVEHIRAALLAAETTDPESVTVHYVGAPRYRVQVAGTQYKQAEEVLKRATEAALASIQGAGGKGSFARA